MSELRPRSLSQRLGRCRMLLESRCRHVRSACSTRKRTRDGTIYDIRVDATSCCPDEGESHFTHVIMHVSARFRVPYLGTCTVGSSLACVASKARGKLLRAPARATQSPSPFVHQFVDRFVDKCLRCCVDQFVDRFVDQYVDLFVDCSVDSRASFFLHALCSDMATDRRLLVAAVHTAFCRIP